MKRNFLGKDVFPLAFGGAAISGEGGGYGFGDISEKDAIELMQYAYDKGVRVFDSAPIYGFGLSEKRMGLALKDVREEVILISKSGVDWHDNKRVNMTNDPKVTEKMLLQSLKSFNTEYIDLFMIHWPDEQVDIRRPLEVLAKYQEKEVIRHVGLCNTNIEDLEKSKEILKLDVVQSEYNLFNRSIEKEILPYVKEHNLDFMSWGTLDKGVLTGKYKVNRHYDESDCRRSAPWWKKNDVEKKLHLIDECKEMLKDQCLLDLAVAFNLSHESLKTVLIGSKNIDQLKSSIDVIKRSADSYSNFKCWNELKNKLQEFYA